MKAIVDLFSTDYGLLSLGVLLFIIFMAWWFMRFFSRKMAESEKNSSS
jgi:flagellar biogenesis protein FliO